eukprot:scaffold52784_cov36-Tisochrysis_lutea.AAC.1
MICQRVTGKLKQRAQLFHLFQRSAAVQKGLDNRPSKEDRRWRRATTYFTWVLKVVVIHECGQPVSLLGSRLIGSGCPLVLVAVDVDVEVRPSHGELVLASPAEQPTFGYLQTIVRERSHPVRWSHFRGLLSLSNAPTIRYGATHSFGRPVCLHGALALMSR